MMDSNNGHPDEDKQLILLKTHKRKAWRQEHYLFYEKDYKRNNCKRVISLDEFNDKTKSVIDNDADINNILSEKNLHNSLITALMELSAIERQIIDECFFYVGTKRKTYEELGRKHNLTKQAYYSKLTKILRKLRRMIEQDFEEF